MTDEEFIKEMSEIFGALQIVSDSEESRAKHKSYFDAHDNRNMYAKIVEPKIIKCKKEKRNART